MPPKELDSGTLCWTSTCRATGPTGRRSSSTRDRSTRASPRTRCSRSRCSRDLSARSQLAIVEVHERPVPSALAIREPEAFVEGAGGDVVLARAEVHVVGALPAGEIDGGFHQGPPESLTTSVRDDVELRQVTLEPIRVDRRAEAKHREPVRPVARD